MRHTIAFVLALLAAPAVYAQSIPPPANGPLVLERIHDGWVIAPDFKVTDFDNRTGELAGAYGGRLIDGTLLIGGAGYWLANDDRDFKLAYGGLVVGWQSPEFGRVRFGGRGLVGAGRATLGFDVTTLRNDVRFGVTDSRAQGTAPGRGPTTVQQPQTLRVRFVGRDDFFVVEPQVNVSARLTKAIGVSCGVGYRATAEADVLRDRLNGPTANLSVQFGW
jgi:hypothetical protein